MKLKGFISKSLELFMGIVITIFILLLTFKLLGVWASYQYEQQAQISAKKLQTAMNYVCASDGIDSEDNAMVVDINLPQKLSSRGEEYNPISFFKNLFGGNTEAVAKGLRYTAALRSFGDPWYVIYYEKFPQGEDTGWSGWSEVASMRTVSLVGRSIDTVSCFIPSLPLFKGIKKIARPTELAEDLFKGGAKVAEKSFKALRHPIESARGVKRAVKKISAIKLLAKDEYGSIINKEARKIYYREIYSGIADKVKASGDDIFEWMIRIPKDKLAQHLEESAEVRELVKDYPEMIELLRKGKRIDQSELDDISKKLGEIYSGVKYVNKRKIDISNNEVREILTDLKGRRFSGLGEDMDDFINKVDDLPLEEGDKNTLINLANRIKKGETPEIEEIEQARSKIPTDLKDYLDEIEGYSKLKGKIDDIDESKLLDDEKPWRLTKELLDNEVTHSTISGLPALGAISKIKVGGKGIWELSKKGEITTRWGTWWIVSDNPVFSFSDVLSLADISMLKFAPCSNNALCLKSQVNPSITVYPLDECKKNGIEYIELRKYASGENLAELSTYKPAIIKVLEDLTLPKHDFLTPSKEVETISGRSDLSCVEDSDEHKIYCFGGKNSNYFSEYIFRFDPFSEEVNIRYSKLPSPRAGLSCVYSSLNKKIYCFGGYNGSYLNETIEYDPNEDKLNIISPGLPYHVADLSCVEYFGNHKIYCFGGYNGSYLNETVEFDPEDNSTSIVGSLPSPRAGLSCVYSSLNKKIYCFGGQSSSGYLDEIVEFGPQIGATTISPKLPFSIGSLSCVEDSDNYKIYCFGGYDGGSYFDNIIMFDPESSTLTSYTYPASAHAYILKALPTKRAGLSCSLDSSTNIIYCFGGKGEGEAYYDDIIKYMPPEPKFVYIPSASRALDQLTGATPYSRFYVASPCGGKLKIWKEECNCALIKKPYIDYDTLKVFLVECTVEDTYGNAKCNFSRIVNYFNEKEVLGTNEPVTVTLKNYNDDEGNLIKYNVTADFTDKIIELDPEYNKSSKDMPDVFDGLFRNNNYFSCHAYISTELPDTFECTFDAPSIPFYTTECIRNNLQLMCNNWTKIGNRTSKIHGLFGESEINTTDWCCKEWQIYECTATIPVLGICTNWEKIIGSSPLELKGNVKECIYDKLDIKNWLNNIFNDQDYIDHIEDSVVNAIRKGSKVNLPENTDPNNETTNPLFAYTLDNKESVDCLKVKFISNETKGFCYTPPPDGETLKEIATFAGSFVAEMGITAVCGIFTRGLGATACEILGCEVGNLIQWYGQNQISKEKEARLWPNNPYFESYFIK